MSSISWTATSGGAWSNGSNWSSGAAPTRGDDVTIATSMPVTVTYSTGTLFLDSLYTSNATLSVTGGTFGVTNGFNIFGGLTLATGSVRLVAGANGNFLGGSVTETSGLLTLVGGALSQGGTFTELGGTLAIANGSFIDRDTGTFSSLIAGSGQMIFDSGPGLITLNSGFALTVASTEIASGNVMLNESLSYGRVFATAQGSTLTLNGNSLTLSGNAALGGDVTSGGTIKATGTGHLNGLILDNGVQLQLTGSYNETGSITLGNTGSGTVSIGAAGSLRLVNDSSIYAGQGGGAVFNNGLLTKAGGASHGTLSTLFDAFTNSSTGTVLINTGILDFHGPSNGFTSTLAGTIAGAGTAQFDAGNYLIASGSNLSLSVARLELAGSASMTLTSALTYSGNWDQVGGTLVVGSPGQSAGALTLNGETALDGGLLKGTGTVLTSGAVNLGAGLDLEGNLQLTFTGPVDQTGAINLGLQSDAITIANVAKGNVWNLEGNAQIAGFNGQINNQGVFAKLDGAANSVVQSGLNNSGTLAVEAGTLTLSGVGTLGGSVIGAAALDISGAYQFGAGLALSVGEVILDTPNQFNEVQASLLGDLSYANQWAQDGGTLALNGHTLALSGVTSLLSGAVEGTGVVVTTGHAILGNGLSILQGADLLLNGATEQTGNVTLTGGSSPPVLTMGGVYTMDAGADLGGPNNSVVGTVVVAGTLVAAGGGAGPNVIGAALIDTGKIQVSHGEMQFMGAVGGTGSISISNGATLDLLGSTGVTNTIGFGAGGAILDLGTPANFTGTMTGFASGDMVELNGFGFAGAAFSVAGKVVTITETSGQSASLTFGVAQTASSLMLGEGPHNGLALIHI